MSVGAQKSRPRWRQRSGVCEQVAVPDGAVTSRAARALTVSRFAGLPGAWLIEPSPALIPKLTVRRNRVTK